MKKISFLLFVAILLAACQPAATPQAVVVPPTSPAVPTQTPAPVESLAGSIDELVGVWWFTQSRMMVEFKADGTSRVFYGSNTYDEGNFTFDNGKVTWATSSACKDKPVTYEVYLTRQVGKPTWLRLQVVGSDPCDVRADAATGKAKFQNP